MSGIEIIGAVSSAITMVETAIKTWDYLCDVCNAEDDRITLQAELSQLHILLGCLRDHVQQLYHMDAQHPSLNSLSQCHFIDAICDIEVCIAEIQNKIPKNVTGAKALQMKLKWPFTKVRIKEILAKIERLKTLIGLAMAEKHAAISMTIQKDLYEYIQRIEPKYATLMTRLASLETDVEHVYSKVIHITERQAVAEDAKLRSDIRQWLAPDYVLEEEMASLRTMHAKGTGEWLMKSREIEDWIAGKQSLFVLRAPPGIGKTVISYVVHQHLSGALRKTVMTVFIKYATTMTMNTVLMRLGVQLIRPEQLVPHALVKLYHDLGAHRSPTNDELVTVLATELQKSSSPVFLVMDALDEYSFSKEDLIRTLLDLPVRIFVTSRPLPDEAFGTPSFISCDMLSSNNNDLATYVALGLTSLPRLKDNSQIVHELSAQVLEASNELFLLASLHLQTLSDCRTIQSLRRKAATLPKTPEGRYAESLERIADKPAEDRSLALHTLMWVWSAKRQLTIEELCQAVASTATVVEYGSIDCIEDAMVSGPELLELCDGLVTQGQKFVGFVHFTVQSFMDSVGETVFASLLPSLATGCLSFMNAPRSSDSIQDLALSYENGMGYLSASTEARGFFDYCARYWGNHAAHTNWDHLTLIFCEFIQNVAAYSIAAWIRRWEILGWRRIEGYRPPSPVHIVASFDLVQLFPALLETIFPDLPDESNQTPLIYAAIMGQTRAVETLLSFDHVNADFRDSAGLTALSWAAVRGHLPIVRLLVAREDVNPTVQHKDEKSPLDLAFICGYLDIFDELLAWDDIRANLAERDGHSLGQAPLLWTEESGSFTDIIAEYLLQKGQIDPHVGDKLGQTPLCWASKQGHLHIVQYLLSLDSIQLNAHDKSGCSPLYWAARNGHADIVAALVARSMVNVNSGDYEQRSPLSWASQRGHLDVIQILLSRTDIDPNSVDHEGRSALSYATQYGRLGVIRTLLSRVDVDVNLQDNWGLTPLHVASRSGQWYIVEDLLTAPGVNVHLQDIDGCSPFHWAVRLDELFIVEAFLALTDVDPNAQDGIGRTPLGWACGSGYLAIVEAFVKEDNTDVNHLDIDDLSPLALAARRGFLDVIETLLAREDVDVNTSDRYGLSPCAWAKGLGHQEVYEALASRGGIVFGPVEKLLSEEIRVERPVDPGPSQLRLSLFKRFNDM